MRAQSWTPAVTCHLSPPLPWSIPIAAPLPALKDDAFKGLMRAAGARPDSVVRVWRDVQAEAAEPLLVIKVTNPQREAGQGAGPAAQGAAAAADDVESRPETGG